MKNPFRWFLTGPDKPRITDPQVVRKQFLKRRYSGVIAMTIGYAMYYVMRLPLSVAKQPLLEAGLTAPQLGVIGAGLTIAVALGKFTNGFIGDHANIKKIIPLGLLGAAIVNVVLGLAPVYYGLFVVMWVLNGCFQSMGSAPATVSLSQWFPKKQLATWYGFFGIAHYLGEGLTYVGTAFIVAALGWRQAFLIPGVICIVLSAVVFYFMNDRPQTYGLPSADEFAGETALAKIEEKTSTKEAQIEAAKNPFVWFAAFSAIFLGITRYSVASWGVIFLQEQGGYEIVTAGSTLGIVAVMGGVGSVLSGIISDKIFKSRHAITSIVFGIVMILGILGIVTLYENRMLCMVSAAVYGFALGIELSFLGGMLAVSLVSQKATGAAMGMVGLLAYFGATAQEIINGWMMGHFSTTVDGVTTYHFESIIIFWVASTILMVVFVFPVLYGQIRQEKRLRQEELELKKVNTSDSIETL
ncbi:MFS transporter [Actinomycetaceae bacterium WB03_NA08]|uniref:MFS transporter n=1 Tax=Scrofimicrobium canadense TaxID=2652290 RepID=A0A6N7WAC2_9ACTO|nr:MFS transporter [Scrofimicrobium canadense]MSS85392.1 MFS transporter [Scrofimicrobium canadense]